MPFAFEQSGRLKAPTPAELVTADGGSSVIVFDHGELADGTPYWVYVAVKPTKYKEFMRLTAARQPICIKDFGAIMRFGFDRQVPGNVKEAMRQDYGFDETYLAMLAQRVRKSRIEFLQERESRRLNDIVAMLKKQ